MRPSRCPVNTARTRDDGSEHAQSSLKPKAAGEIRCNGVRYVNIWLRRRGLEKVRPVLSVVSQQPARAQLACWGHYGGKLSRCGEEEATSRSLQLWYKPRAAHADKGEGGGGREKKKVARPLPPPLPPLGSCKWTRLTRLKSATPTGQSLEVLLGTKVSLRPAAEPCVSSDTLEVSGPPADGRHFTQWNTFQPSLSMQLVILDARSILGSKKLILGLFKFWNFISIKMKSGNKQASLWVTSHENRSECIFKGIQEPYTRRCVWNSLHFFCPWQMWLACIAISMMFMTLYLLYCHTVEQFPLILGSFIRFFFFKKNKKNKVFNIAWNVMLKGLKRSNKMQKKVLSFFFSAVGKYSHTSQPVNKVLQKVDRKLPALSSLCRVATRSYSNIGLKKVLTTSFE